MKSAIITACMGLAAVSWGAAVPTVSDVVMSEDAATRTVTVTYTLANAPGIVTAMFLTNGVPVDSVTALGGDVNRYVTNANSTCSFTWIPEKSWPWHLIEDGSMTARVTAWATNAPPDYMAINLSVTNAVFFHERAADVPGGITNDMYKTEWLLMRKIHAKDVVWHMGSPTFESNRSADYEVMHPVRLTYDYYIGVYMATQRQYQRITRSTSLPGSFTSSSTYPDSWGYPVNGLKFSVLRGTTYAWPADGHKVTEGSFMGKLRALTGIDSFDLPTEAEWEYACRAGTFTAHYDGTDTTNSLANLGWYVANSAVNGTRIPHVVGLKQPNPWGLYDMYGNLAERCLDWRAPYENTDRIAVDPVGAASGSSPVTRGGTIDHSHENARSAARDGCAAEAGSYYGAMRLRCSAALSF